MVKPVQGGAAQATYLWFTAAELAECGATAVARHIQLQVLRAHCRPQRTKHGHLIHCEAAERQQNSLDKAGQLQDMCKHEAGPRLIVAWRQGRLHLQLQASVRWKIYAADHATGLDAELGRAAGLNGSQLPPLRDAVQESR